MEASGVRRSEIGLLTLLVFSVLAFGSTPYWARTAVVAGSALLFAYWWAREARPAVPEAFRPAGERPGLLLGGVHLGRSGFGVLALLFLAVVALQMLPLPAGVRALLSPGVAVRQEVSPELAGSISGGSSGWAPLSVDPSGTLDALLLLTAYGMLFILTYNLLDSRERLVRLARVLVAVAFLIALGGLVQELSGTERIYGIKAPRYGGAPFGPFVNHNNFAGYMEMTIPLTFGLLLRRLRRPPEQRPPLGPGAPSGPGSVARRMLGDTGLRGERFGQATLLALAAAVMVSALVLCLSRGGLLSLAAASTMVLVLMAVGGHLGRWEVAGLGMVGVVMLGFFLWLGPEPVLGHFRRAESVQNEPSLSIRPVVWGCTLRAFEEAPVLGWGLGSYATAFLHHYPAGTQHLWFQAHNDYVQLLAEAGLAGAAVAGVALLLLLGRLLLPLVRRARLREKYLFCGLAVGILSLLIHSLVEFNLQIPANGAHFVVLCAMALAHRRLLPTPKEA